MARAAAAAKVPAGILDVPGFRTVSRTADELSIVAPESGITGMETVDGGWACFKLHGPFAFSETGILAGLSKALADRQIGIFAISTFDTDYILVKQADAEGAIKAWQSDGHEVD